MNFIPTQFYGTDLMAAPMMSIAGMLLIGVPGYIYLEIVARKARNQGRGFVADINFVETTVDQSSLPSWHWLAGLLPIIAVALLLNVFKQHIVTSLLGGILTCCVMNIRQAKILLPAISFGAEGSLRVFLNISCAVGFGSVVMAVPGFAILTAMMMDMPGNILFSQAVAINIMAGVTGSASGGMSIILSALGPQYLAEAIELGINPEYLHRIASIASGGLHAMPHNGGILTLLAISGCTHKESYWDVFVTIGLIPTIVSLALAYFWVV
jgi:H+/gluconate symporter-like permease